MATAKAMTHVVKEKGGAAAMKMMKKSLGPAYLTYLAGAAPIALAASYVGKAMKEYSDEKAMKSKKKKKKPMIKKAGIDPDIAMKAGKAFMYGAVPTTVIGAAVYNSPKFKKFLRLEQEVLKKRITKTDDEDFKDNLKGKIMGNRYLEQNPNKAAIAQGIAAGILTSIIYSEYPLLKGLKKKVYLR